MTERFEMHRVPIAIAKLVSHLDELLWSVVPGWVPLRDGYAVFTSRDEQGVIQAEIQPTNWPAGSDIRVVLLETGMLLKGTIRTNHLHIAAHEDFGVAFDVSDTSSELRLMVQEANWSVSVELFRQATQRNRRRE